MRIKNAVLVSLILMASQAGFGQTFLMQTPAEGRPAFGARLMRPYFADADIDLSTLSGALDFFVNVPVGRQINLVGRFAFNNVSIKGAGRESGVGDLYVGLQSRHGEGSGLSASGGVYLPTATEHLAARAIGLLSNLYEFPRSLPHVLTLYTNVAYHYRPRGILLASIEAGPTFSIPTGENRGDAELLVHYGGALGVKVGALGISGELLGVAVITEDVENFGDRFNHFVDLGIQLVKGEARPALFYQIPLDDEFAEIDGVLGIKVELIAP